MGLSNTASHGGIAAASALVPLIGRLVLLAAFVITTVGTVPFAFADATTSTWWLGAALFVRGMGVGAMIIAPILAAYADMSHGQMPHASMVTRIVQPIGGSVGAAIVTVALHLPLADGLTMGFRGAFWWRIAITVVALVPALAFRRTTITAT